MKTLLPESLFVVLLGGLGVVSWVGLAGCSAPPAETPRVRPAPRPRPEVYQPYAFTLNGKAFEPDVLSAHGEPARPRPGDVVEVEGVNLMLGELRRCHFVTQKTRPHVVLLRRPGGKLVVVGASVTSRFQGDKLVPVNPLTSLSPPVIRGLWGVHLGAWPKGIARQLSHLRASKTCLTVTQDAAKEPKRPLPPLPAGLRCLLIKESSSEGILDFRALAKLTALRFFALRRLTSKPFDAALLARARALRYLDLSGQPVGGTTSLAGLTELRQLDLGYADGVTQIRFVRGMRHLRWLSLNHTKISDLKPMVALKQLRTLKADVSAVRRLPMTKLPRLRTLRVMSTPLARSSVQRFRQLNPRCRVWHGWAEALQHTLRGTTRIRVRSGGTCHRREKQERTLATVVDAREIRKVLGQLQFEEPSGIRHCMCCGNPSIELYRRSKLLATLGVHHGHSLRWSSGWPGDAPLTDRSRDFLTHWLARRGAPEMLREQQRRRRQARAAKRRSARYRELLPDATWQALTTAGNRAAAKAAFQTAAKTPLDRALLYFRLYGCHDDSWNLYAGLDRLLKSTLLPGLSPAVLVRAAKRAIQQARKKTPQGLDALRGAARWLLVAHKAAGARKKLSRSVFLRLVMVGVTSPRRPNQRRALYGLTQQLKGRSIPLLRRIYGGRIKPRTLPADQRAEPDGMMEFSAPDTLCDGCSLTALAAHYLVQLGYRAIRRSLKLRAATAKGADKKAYLKLWQSLTKKRAPKRPPPRR